MSCGEHGGHEFSGEVGVGVEDCGDGVVDDIWAREDVALDGVDDVVCGSGSALFDSACGATGPVGVLDSRVGEGVACGGDHAVLAVVVSGVEGLEVVEDLVEGLTFEEAVADEHSVSAVGVYGGLCGDGTDACEYEGGFACQVKAGEAGC